MPCNNCISGAGVCNCFRGADFVKEKIFTAASKNDQTKPDHSLLTQVFLDETSRAMQVGEKKYGRYNYCKGHKISQILAAISRHTAAINNGEEFDPIDGQSHAGSIAANINMLLRQKELGTLIDDRFKPEEKK